jgi:hypothetical protein
MPRFFFLHISYLCPDSKGFQRENLKNEFAASLVGPYQLCAYMRIYFIHSLAVQAVKTLSEVRRIQDIPATFFPPPPF